MKSSLIAAIMAVIISSSTSAETVSYPVGTVIEVTEEGVLVSAPTISNNTDPTDSTDSTDSTGSTDTTTTVYVDESEYCYGADYALVDCEPSRNFDPWIASTGEKHYWIRNRLTFAIPFTLPHRTHEHASKAKFGYFQMTASERKRNPETEDIFRVWFSEEPNGVPLGGKGSKCEKWMVKARGYIYWTQDADLAAEANVCFLGHSEKVLYANFETACYAGRYKGECSDENKQKSHKSYQFDVARQVRGY